jgi:acetyl-CoA C-acetyltransferase
MPSEMPASVILSTARTPVTKMGGGLANVDAAELGAVAIKEALERADVDGEQVEHLVMGQVLQAGQGQIPSRQAQIKAGIPKEVSSETVNKVCASGLRSSVLLDDAIRAGEMHVGVAGGMESMSKAPYLVPQGRFGYRMGDAKLLDAMVHDGLTNPFSGEQMIIEATAVGDELEMTRVDLDRWALRSHERALAAIDDGRMGEEIVAVSVPAARRGKEPTVVETDEGPRRDTSLEKLAALPGVASKEGSHTAGNSPGVNDGAGALVVASDEWAHAEGKEVLAEIVAHAQSANDFAYLATTPASAATKALQKAGISAADIDLWEINEAFASVTLNSIRVLGIDEDKVNVNGGAIALGHPIGASGARILGALVLELRRRGGGLGCAAICSGGGQGDALIVRV